MSPLMREFYDRSAVEVARELLGCHLVRKLNGHGLVGIICETEAYQGEEDLGCHAHVGKTARNAVMYDAPGHAYIYFTYGMHWLLNAVTGPENVAAAVLIRSVYPLDGLDQMVLNRPNLAYRKDWLNGPAKICQAFGLGGRMNGVDLCDPIGDLMIEQGKSVPEVEVRTSARIGLFTVPEPWKSIPWRFMADMSALGKLR
jgi:DNA-3-methyladenine glycosylase